jgi:uracil-DNA glycosylase
MDATASQAALHALAAEAAGCTRCPLHLLGTQTVFGEGPATAALMLVGEQPGDQEDRRGHPFVGPAGKVLDAAVAEAGIDRAATYLTNVVKHFKHAPRGRIRLHRTPAREEVEACRWWLDRELALLRPRVVVALGVTAASALMRRKIVLSRERGRRIALPDGRAALVTMHPSALLRMPDPQARTAAQRALVADLRLAAAIASGANAAPATPAPSPGA